MVATSGYVVRWSVSPWSDHGLAGVASPRVTGAKVPRGTVLGARDQMDDHNAVPFCTTGPSVGTSYLVWWSYLV
jgi:hypothetical protein